MEIWGMTSEEIFAVAALWAVLFIVSVVIALKHRRKNNTSSRGGEL